MIGSLLKERYQVEKELGRGGFGVVYLAHDQQLMGKPVVIKILTDDLSSDPWPLKKFRQEIEALARIDHPGVIGALDTGETGDGRPFLVMQFVEGVMLRSLIPQEGMALERAADLIKQVGQALGAAHDRGVWHRDLKPENVMIQQPGGGEEYVKLIDFGIAAIKDSQFAGVSETTKVAGSYAYMAPEQFAGNPSSQSDIWAFGVIAYEMLTGRKPFPTESLFELMMQQQKGVPVPPRQLRPAIPLTAEQTILRALSYDVLQRFERPREFGDTLARALTSSGDQGRSGAVLFTSPTATTAFASASQQSTPRVEMAHVVFMDLVAYSKQFMDQGTGYVQELQQLVRQTPAFQEAERHNELLRLPTGDGMALVFFGDPQTAAQCAVEISAALQSRPHLKLRLGIHTGPVFRINDINQARNVAGGGINMAQRVMDAGDGGHILCSKSTAEVLQQLGRWAPYIHDLGEQSVKHDVKVHLFNLYTPDVGNSAWPTRLPKPRHLVQEERSKRQTRRALIGAGVSLAALIGGLIGWRKMNPAKPELSFHYSVAIKRLPDGPESSGGVGKTIMQAGMGVAVTVGSEQGGLLYIVNKGPMPDGSITYNFLYPKLKQPATFKAGESFRIPTKGWLEFDKAHGEELLYLVWAAGPVPDLDRLKDSESDGQDGHVVIRDEVRKKALDEFLSKHRVADARIETDESANRHVVRDRADILVRLVSLTHMGG